MAWEPPRLVLNPYQDQTTQDIVNTVQTPQRTRKPTLSPELQISSAQFNLPEGWIVEERPRRSNPTHVDRYYYEPHTRKQFRSLCAVQRYLAGEEVTPRRMKSKKKLIESGEGQSSSMRAVSNFLLEENPSPTTSKSPMNSGSGEKRVRSTRYEGRYEEESVYRPTSVAKEEIINPMSWKYSVPARKSVKLDYQNKTISESSGTSSAHNLTTPPPAKISWVLSGPTGTWNPRVGGSPVPQSEKLNWSEAFIQSLGRDDGPSN
ncbi:methyl-CpG-binding domain-containing protein 7-like isoform X2 [Vigna unguiculata]|uniref:methyl-CpG-binding domain-containing protein 7-like isoform X2 n=1 Tax=Vigna unguiculata TaxID=3917 RepID=UPI001015FBD1|nr:methyl-CpG-binding domain-containing protein 7-like isoform X2 [Vigna unguiculata]